MSDYLKTYTKETFCKFIKSSSESRCGDVLLTDWDKYMVTGIHKICGESILEVVNSTGKKSTYNVNDYIKTCFIKYPTEELDFFWGFENE